MSDGELTVIPPDVAALCADWWAERFMIDGMRYEFRTVLYRRLTEVGLHAGDCRGFGVRLRVDYDPQNTLLDVVRALGIECSGFMFSADGILPRKREMKIYQDGGVEVFDGRVPGVWLRPRPEHP